MFFFIPYRSDVAARQFVWGTVGVIAANLAVALLLGFPGPSPPPPGEAVFIDHWVLHFGTLNPLAWITSAFIHFGWAHLIFNMIFLWAFGFVVESLLGWRRFLLLYVALAAADGCLTQLVMLGSEGGAAGASGMVYALMVIAALWAPRNELTVFVWFITLIRSAFKTSVLTFCVIWVGLDLLWVFLQGFRMSSELLHVFGALVGGGAGWLMLDKGWVDTEGWDLLSLRRGDPRARRQAELREMMSPVAGDGPELSLRDALVEVRDALEEGQPVRAEAAYVRGKRVSASWVLPQAELRALALALLEAGALEPAVARMEEYADAHPDDAIPMRLRLAAAHLDAGRPSRAIEEVARLDGLPLDDEQRRRTRQLEQRAAKDLESGRLELE